MRQTLIAGAALIILAACGAGGASDRDAIVVNCVASNEAAETCGCMADAMKAKLSQPLFKKVADTARSGDTPADMLPTLTLDQQQQFAKVLPDLMSCAVGANAN